MRIKRWTGSAWVDDLPTVGISNIETTGTPSSSTFLRGDGAWATPAGSSDADTVDSLHASSFIRSDANDNFSGTLNYTPDTGTILAVDGQAVIQRMTANGALTIGHDDAVIIAGGDTSGVLNSNINNSTETVFVGAEGGFVAYAFPSNNTAWSNRKEMNWNGTNLTLLGNNVATQAWVNSQGFLTSETGDIQGVTAGTGLSGGGTSGTVTLNLDLSEFTDMTDDVNGLQDEMILLDNGAERKKLLSEIKLSQFNNDAGWASGDITNLTAGDGLTGGGSSGSVTISHADTSSQASVNNSGRTYIQDITLDTYGHITGITSATETVTNTNTQLSNEQVQDIVGAMVSSNSESGISVTYQDTDGTLDFNVNDPTITLTGDVTGSATMTNLGNVSITATVADDSHNHTIANVDGLSSSLANKVDTAGDTMTGDLTLDHDGESTANDSHGVVLTARFNSIDFTRKLYMDDGANLLFGTNTIFHSGNDGSSSGLHADLLDGQQGSYYLDYNNFSNTPTIPSSGNTWTEIKTGQTTVSGGTGATNISLSQSIDDTTVIAFELNTGSAQSYTSQIFIVKIEDSNSIYSGVLFNSGANSTYIRTGSIRVFRTLSMGPTSTSVSFAYSYYHSNGSSSETSDTVYIGKIWKLGVTGA